MQEPMRMLMRPLGATVLIAAWLFSVPAANAQAQSPSPAPSQSQNISNEKLDATAAAMEQVTSVKQNYQQRIEAAAPSERQRITE